MKRIWWRLLILQFWLQTTLGWRPGSLDGTEELTFYDIVLPVPSGLDDNEFFQKEMTKIVMLKQKIMHVLSQEVRCPFLRWVRVVDVDVHGPTGRAAVVLHVSEALSGLRKHRLDGMWGVDYLPWWRLAEMGAIRCGRFEREEVNSYCSIGPMLGHDLDNPLFASSVWFPMPLS
jgi:hypothetical protein